MRGDENDPVVCGIKSGPVTPQLHRVVADAHKMGASEEDLKLEYDLTDRQIAFCVEHVAPMFQSDIDSIRKWVRGEKPPY